MHLSDFGSEECNCNNDRYWGNVMRTNEMQGTSSRPKFWCSHFKSDMPENFFMYRLGSLSMGASWGVCINDVCFVSKGSGVKSSLIALYNLADTHLEGIT